ncbi:MAG: antibiotic biosynthesis monooxygenase [Deltaproteobacteria bacterium]|nr:antibiotic biosynthesis monooxygenase [Deltaproteobacteria bacterium]
MADKKVTVVARIKTKAGMEEKVKQELLSLQVPTRSEPGCINYDIHQSVDDKSLFLLYENWASKDDLDKHFEMTYLKAWREKAKDLVAAPTEVSFWEMIS